VAYPQQSAHSVCYTVSGCRFHVPALSYKYKVSVKAMRKQRSATAQPMYYSSQAIELLQYTAHEMALGVSQPSPDILPACLTASDSYVIRVPSYAVPL
jgi:hypothetical protein